MGYRRTKNIIDKVIYPYKNSKYTTKTNPFCRNCPCRIYNSSNEIKYGRGNIFSKIMIVLSAYKVDNETFPVEEQIIQELFALVNINVFEDCYITRAIKCYSDDKGVNKNSTYSCFNNFINEVNFIKPKVIICFGGLASMYPIWLEQKGYKVLYYYFTTPFVKLYNKEDYEILKKDIQEKLSDIMFRI